jgi:hypothetical protein
MATCIAAALVAPAAAQDSGISRIETLGTSLRSEAAWQADYHQEYLPAGMDTGEELIGKVWVAWPDRAVFRSGNPVQRLMGLEGRRVRLLDLEVESCDEHLLSDDEWARIPLAAVLDPGGAVKHFTVVAHGERGIVLAPREPGGVDRVEVVLGNDNLPLEVVVVDPQGATNRLRFTDWRPADGPPDEQWLPQAPPDLTCVTDAP